MSSVKFLSFVDEDESGNWFIKLIDTFDDSEVICKDLDDYEKKLSDMASEYGNDIEVIWEKSKKLSPKNILDLQNKMDKLKEKYEDEIRDLQNNQNGEFNPNV